MGCQLDKVYILLSYSVLRVYSMKFDLEDGETLTRDELLSTLRAVIRLSFEKIRYVNTSNTDKQSWARIINSAVSSTTPLLRDSELSELKAEIEKIKAVLEGRPVAQLVR